MRGVSDAQEKRVAKRTQKVGGKKVGGSGCGGWQKGDVLTEQVFLECKTNAAPRQSITVQKAWLEKAKQQAFSMRKPEYALVLSFGDGKDYGMVDMDFLARLLEDSAELVRIMEGKKVVSD